MAVDFGNNNTTNYYKRASTGIVLPGDTEWCIGFWVKIEDNSGTGFQYSFSNELLSVAGAFATFLVESGTTTNDLDDRWHAYARDSFGNAIYTDPEEVSAGQFGADGVERLVIFQMRAGAGMGYWYCAKGGTTFFGDADAAVPPTDDIPLNDIFIAARGADLHTGRFYEEHLGHVFVMTGQALSDAEIEALGAGDKTIIDVISASGGALSLANLRAYWKLLDKDDLTDYSGSGLTLSKFGSTAVTSPFEFIQGGLSVTDASQAQSADPVVLEPVPDLVVPDAVQAQSADAVSLDAGQPTITIADARQAQTAEAPALAPGLIVPDASQGQSADAISLGLPTTVVAAPDFDSALIDPTQCSVTNAGTATPTIFLATDNLAEILTSGKWVTLYARVTGLQNKTPTVEIDFTNRHFGPGTPAPDGNFTNWAPVWRYVGEGREAWRRVPDAELSYDTVTDVLSWTPVAPFAQDAVEFSCKPRWPSGEWVTLWTELDASPYVSEPASAQAFVGAPYVHAAIPVGAITQHNSFPFTESELRSLRLADDADQPGDGLGKQALLVLTGQHPSEDQGDFFFSRLMRRLAEDADALTVKVRRYFDIYAYNVNVGGRATGHERWSEEAGGDEDTNRAWNDTGSETVEALKTAILSDTGGSFFGIIDCHGAADRNTIPQVATGLGEGPFQIFHGGAAFPVEVALRNRMKAKRQVFENTRGSESVTAWAVGQGATFAFTFEFAEGLPGYPDAAAMYDPIVEDWMESLVEAREAGELGVAIAVSDARQSQSADTISLSPALVVAAAAQAQGADPVTLVDGTELIITDARQGQHGESLSLMPVIAVADARQGQAADPIALGLGAAPPAAPSALSATAVSASQINLAWTDNSDDETGFELQRSTSPAFGAPTTLNLAADATTKSDTALAAATQYYYRVRAVNAAGASAWSATALATTQANPPATPTGLTATAVGASQVDLAWADNAGDETGFEVQYSTDFGFAGAQTLGLAADAETLSLTGLSAETTYYCRVRATGTGLPSNWSNIAAATTEAAAAQPQAGDSPLEPPFIVVPKPFIAISATSELAGYPARLLQRPNLMSEWRTDQPAASLDIQVAGPIDTVALLNTNGNDAATWTISADPTLAGAQGAAPAFTTGDMQLRASAGLGVRPGYHALARLGQSVPHTYWRITVSHAAALFSAAILVMGQARVSPKNYSKGSSEEAVDAGRFELQRDGGVAMLSGVRQRTRELDISLLNEADIEALFGDLWWQAGLSSPVLACANAKPGAYLHDRILFGPLSRHRRTHSWSRHHDQTFEILSMI